MRIFTLFSLILLLVMCSWKSQEVSSTKGNSQIPANLNAVAPKSNYDSLKIPTFFKQIAANHKASFIYINSKNCKTDFMMNGISLHDSLNIKHYSYLYIIHSLFTSNSAYNGSRGSILNIPYLWHWVKPNPRHTITYIPKNKPLKTIKPTQGFGKYGSFADIDRTPFLFLSDMLSEQPNYYKEGIDTFSTFGWCSEREMAYVALLSTLGYEAKVVTSGTHSWTEVVKQLVNDKDKMQWFKFKVDSTFNHFNISAISDTQLKSWRANMGSIAIEKWYNKKALSSSEHQKIKNYVVPLSAAKRIELKICNYINKR